MTNGPAVYRKLTSRSLAAKADPASGEPTELIADGGVRIEQPGSEGAGRQMVYNHSTQIFKLLGRPRIETPKAIFTSEQRTGLGQCTRARDRG